MKKLFFTLITVALAQLALAQTQVTLSGATSGNKSYATLKEAIDSINYYSQTSRNIVVTINANTTESATSSLSAGAWTSLTIKPAASATPTVTCNINAPLILLNGADNVTIDGSNSGGTSKDLTLENRSTLVGAIANPCATVALMNGATSNIIKNCNLKGSSKGGSYGGIVVLYTSTSSGNSNNTITNNTFSKSGGTTPKIQLFNSGSQGKSNSSNTITNNIFQYFSEAAVKIAGNSQSNIYSNNTITINNDTTVAISGISINEVAASNPSANETISANQIVGTATTNHIYGVFIGTRFSSTLAIVNNIIRLTTSGNTPVLYGVYDLYSGSTSVSKILHNTIQISGSGTAISACMRRAKNVFCEVANNIFVNKKTGGLNYIAYHTTASSTTYTSNYNDMYKTETGRFAYINGDKADFDTYKVSGWDLNSISVDPPFISSTDLHISTSTFTLLNNGGGVLTSLPVTTDYDNNARSSSMPDIGADEFSGASLVWTGATSTDWSTSTNWDANLVPLGTTDVTIPGASNNPLISCYPTDPAKCANLTIQSGGELTIDLGRALTVNNTLSNSGTLTIKGGFDGNGSLLSSTSGVNVVAQCYMPRKNSDLGIGWLMMSPPVVGQSIASFVSSYDNDVNFSTNLASNVYALRPFNEATNKWGTYYSYPSPAGSFESGKGYSVMRLSTDVAANPDVDHFTYLGTTQGGTVNASVTGTGTRWNCIGNPFTSPVNLTSINNTVDDFLSINAASLDPSYTVYYLDDSQFQYKTISNAERESYIPVGAGFLVRVKDASVTSLQFTQSMRIHQSDVIFRSANTDWTGFKLKVNNGTKAVSTSVYFNQNMTKGLDPTYDAGFLRYNSELAIYTKLAQDNGLNFAIQCLPDAISPSEAIMIPIGFDLTAGGSVTFSTSSFTLPLGVIALLEDRETGSFTNLKSEDVTYTTTVPANTTGTGRFFLHLLNKTITDVDVNPTTTSSMYVSGNSLFVTGKVSTTALLTVSDSRGVVVGNYSLNGSNTVSLKGLSNGIYIVTLKDGGVTKTQKVVLQ